MAAEVQIHSKVNITVTKDLAAQDHTNPDAHIPDRLKVAPTWLANECKIKEGQHVYPAEIADWATVQALAADGILTINRLVAPPANKSAVKKKTATTKKTLGEIVEAKAVEADEE